MTKTRFTTRERLRRLLSLIPWVAAQDGASLDQIAERFDYPRDRLLADLNDVVFMVGVYPFTPDQLIEVVVEDDRVWIRYADAFARPLRLTPEQALSVLAAGTSLLRGPGTEDDGPLARGLAKLAAAVGVDPGAAVDVDLGPAPGDLVTVLQDAVAASRRVRIDYYAYGRDQRSSRVVDPYRVFADRGQWYLTGWCHDAGGERVFRLDRIHDMAVLDQTFSPPAALPPVSVYHPRSDDPRVTLRLAPAASWVVDQYPCESVETADDGTVTVRLAVSEEPWLERLLLRLGPDATVVATEGGVAPDLVAQAARRVLARYDADT